MSKNTKIEWADHTFNPWVGCTKVSPACDHCYAEGWAKRSGMVKWGPNAERRRTSENNWRQPLRWDAEAGRLGIRYRVFCSSLADVFDNAVPTEWRKDLFTLIAATPHLDWLLLTKRIGNAPLMLLECIGTSFFPDHGNIWIGITVCNQIEADRDIPKLLAIRSKKRFLSVEPLLGEIDISEFLRPYYPYCSTGFQQGTSMELGYCATCAGHEAEPIHTAPEERIDWVIVGGESGAHARPMHPEWVRSLSRQCHWAGVPFFFKQWGEWREPLEGEEFDTSMGRAAKPPAFILSETGTVHCFENEHIVNGTAVIKVGKKLAGRLLDGYAWDEVPTCGATLNISGNIGGGC